MVQPDNGTNYVHIVFLCGGNPSFQAASEVRKVVVAQQDSCNIIHVDREQEGRTYWAGDHFIELPWGRVTIEQIQENADLLEMYGKDRIEQVIAQFEEGDPPADNPFAIRLAVERLRDVVKGYLMGDLRYHLLRGAVVYVAISLVPEGPTGTGVAWALMDWLPQWRESLSQQARATGGEGPNSFHFFLLEFVPANPDLSTQGGGEGNVVQGYMSRTRLYDQNWPYYWFRWDGGKLKTDLNPISNAEATRIGAMAMGLVLTRRIVPPTMVSR